MKKKILMMLTVIATMGLVVSGCGSESKKVTVEIETESAVDVTEDTSVKSDVTEIEEEVIISDYLMEHGITITPCNEVTSMVIADYNSDELHERKVSVSVEAVPSEEDGYTDTTLKVIWDTSENKDLSTWYGIYDRYTGIDLEYSYIAFESEGGTATNTAIVEVDGKRYDCAYTFDWNTSAEKNYVATFTLHHPSEYDGLVFSVGGDTTSMKELRETLDTSVVHKLADFPELIEGYYFFTATDN